MPKKKVKRKPKPRLTLKSLERNVSISMEKNMENLHERLDIFFKRLEFLETLPGELSAHKKAVGVHGIGSETGPISDRVRELENSRVTHEEYITNRMAGQEQTITQFGDGCKEGFDRCKKEDESQVESIAQLSRGLDAVTERVGELESRFECLASQVNSGLRLGREDRGDRYVVLTSNPPQVKDLHTGAIYQRGKLMNPGNRDAAIRAHVDRALVGLLGPDQNLKQTWKELQSLKKLLEPRSPGAREEEQ